MIVLICKEWGVVGFKNAKTEKSFIIYSIFLIFYEMTGTQMEVKVFAKIIFQDNFDYV